MQCDFTDLRINRAVASPRSQIGLRWIFANEALRPEILVDVTARRLVCLLPFVSGSLLTLLRSSTSRIVCVLSDDHLVEIDFINYTCPFFPLSSL